MKKKSYEDYFPLKSPTLAGSGRDNDPKIYSFVIVRVFLISNKAHEEITDEPKIHNPDERNSESQPNVRELQRQNEVVNESQEEEAG